MDNLLKDHRCPTLCRVCKGWALTIQSHKTSSSTLRAPRSLRPQRYLFLRLPLSKSKIRYNLSARTMPPTQSSRLSYIDWMRGLACLLMFQTHCYDAWLRPDLRDSALYHWSQLGGTLPAPLFIFLAGISMALVTERLREKGIARNIIAKQTALRGAEIFALGLLFRLQEYALATNGFPGPTCSASTSSTSSASR